MTGDGFPYPVDLPGNFSRPADPAIKANNTPRQGTINDEAADPLKTAIWQALMPFAEELISTGGVTFMGLRNAIVAAVEPFVVRSSDTGDQK